MYLRLLRFGNVVLVIVRLLDVNVTVKDGSCRQYRNKTNGLTGTFLAHLAIVPLARTMCSKLDD
jgi:hypothetical protein